MNFLLMFWKPLAIVGVGAFLWWQIFSWIEDYREMKEGYDSRMAQLVQERNQTSIEKQSLEATLREKERNAKRLELLRRVAQRQAEIAKADLIRQTAVFEGHDLAKAANRHPEWLAKLATNASQERLDELEDLFND